MADLPLVPLSHAYDALGDLVSRFHNDMLRAGVKELPAKEWAEKFRSWIDAYDFERQYEDTLKWSSERADG